MVHTDHMKRFYANGPPFTWGEGIGNDSEQLNDWSGMDNGNMAEDNAENLLHEAMQFQDNQYENRSLLPILHIII